VHAGSRSGAYAGHRAGTHPLQLLTVYCNGFAIKQVKNFEKPLGNKSYFFVKQLEPNVLTQA
jgi:hypothetical protein